MSATSTLTVTSPLGHLALRAREDEIIALDWVDGVSPPANTPVLQEAARQLDAYFAGERTAFDLPLTPDGTDHQKRVWAAMSQIPFGGVRTYGDLARDIGSSARAVGTACGKNPIPVIVPCHRVIAAGSGIGGYSGRGGLETKRVLLALEGVRPDR